MKVLVVQHAFSVPAKADDGKTAADPKTYSRGDMVSDPAEMKAVRDFAPLHAYTASDVPDDFFKADPPAADPAPKAKA